MEPQILIDTNVCIGYFGCTFDSRILDLLDILIEHEYHLSVINQIELLGFNDLLEEEERNFKLLINNGFLHGLNEEIIEKTIEIRKKYHIKIPDAIIAATCLVHKLQILTQNTRDFDKIEQLIVLSPESLDSH